MPRWESASISSSGRRVSQAASATGPGDVAAAAHHDVGAPAHQQRAPPAASAAAASTTAQRLRSESRRTKPAQRDQVLAGSPRRAHRPDAPVPRAPMKPTSAPRARSASATASAGITWPPVPPAAIVTLTGRDGGEPAGVAR